MTSNAIWFFYYLQDVKHVSCFSLREHGIVERIKSILAGFQAQPYIRKVTKSLCQMPPQAHFFTTYIFLMQLFTLFQAVPHADIESEA